MSNTLLVGFSPMSDTKMSSFLALEKIFWVWAGRTRQDIAGLIFAKQKSVV